MSEPDIGRGSTPAEPADERIDTARRRLSARFREAGLETPEPDARILVGHAPGLDHGALIAAGQRRLAPDERHCISEMEHRRLARVPVAQIVGSREFWGLPLSVTRATLTPRPDTETLVEAALVSIDRTGGRARPLSIVDLGTGTGATLLALLVELPMARGLGVDISAEALAVARANAGRHGLAARALFHVADFGSALRGRFDLVVSNPPYVTSGELAALPPEVRDHEPHIALDGGPDGLAAYRVLAGDASRLLVPDGLLAVEIGQGQAAAVTTIGRAAGLRLLAIHPDLAGIDRALVFTNATGASAAAGEKALGLWADTD